MIFDLFLVSIIFQCSLFYVGGLMSTTFYWAFKAITTKLQVSFLSYVLYLDAAWRCGCEI